MTATLVISGSGLAPGVPTNAAKATVAAGATSAAVAILGRSLAAGIENLVGLVNVVAMETATGPGLHIVFGDVNVAAPTAADAPVKNADGVLTFTIGPKVTHYRIFGEGTSAGSVYAWPAA